MQHLDDLSVIGHHKLILNDQTLLHVEPSILREYWSKADASRMLLQAEATGIFKINFEVGSLSVD